MLMALQNKSPNLRYRAIKTEARSEYKKHLSRLMKFTKPQTLRITYLESGLTVLKAKVAKRKPLLSKKLARQTNFLTDGETPFPKIR